MVNKHATNIVKTNFGPGQKIEPPNIGEESDRRTTNGRDVIRCLASGATNEPIKLQEFKNDASIENLIGSFYDASLQFRTLITVSKVEYYYNNYMYFNLLKLLMIK